MKPLNELNKEEILSGEIFEEILNEEDETKRADLISDLKLKAKDLRVKGIFEEKLNTYKKIDRETKRKYKSGVSSNSAPPDSNIADVLQMLDYKIEYDKDGNEKGSKLQQTVRNFEIIMDNDNRFSGKIKFDEFSRQEYLMGEIPWESENCDRAWGSHDDAALYSIIQTDYGVKNRNDYFDAIKNVSMRNKFHPVRDILDGLEFDGEEHIRSLLPDYLGVEDTEYSYQVMRLWMMGAVARVYEPGCKFDYTMIFTGPQGLGKSTFLKMMALNDSWFNDSLDSLDSDKAAQSLMGSWIVELAELKSLARTAGGVESVKRFLTAVQDKYRVPYERRADIFLRQCVFAGTTNKSDFLQDETGNRRFLIIQTGVNKPTKSLFVPEAIEDMKAAWAQAVHIWKEERPELLLPDSCRDEARRLQDESMADDGKVGIIGAFLEDKQRTCVLEIWKEALGENGRPQKWQSSEIIDIILSFPNWERVKNPARYKEYGMQKLLQKRLPSNQNLTTKCIPSTTSSIKNGSFSGDSSKNSDDGFMNLDDYLQGELPFE